MSDTDAVRLNLGSGRTATPGWVCIDRSPNIWLSRFPFVKRLLGRLGILSEGHMAPWDLEVVRGDVRALGYSDGSVDAIYSSHMLEHIYLADARQVLREARRVLKPNGVLRLALPDAAEHARRLVAGEEAGDGSAAEVYNAALLAHPAQRTSGVRAFVGNAGAHTHLWQPTPSLLAKMLQEVGFRDIRRRRFREGDLPGVEGIEMREEGFHMEARV